MKINKSKIQNNEKIISQGHLMVLKSNEKI